MDIEASLHHGVFQQPSGGQVAGGDVIAHSYSMYML